MTQNSSFFARFISAVAGRLTTLVPGISPVAMVLGATLLSFFAWSVPWARVHLNPWLHAKTMVYESVFHAGAGRGGSLAPLDHETRPVRYAPWARGPEKARAIVETWHRGPQSHALRLPMAGAPHLVAVWRKDDTWVLDYDASLAKAFYPGEGDRAFRCLARTLHENGYRGWLEWRCLGQAPAAGGRPDPATPLRLDASIP